MGLARLASLCSMAVLILLTLTASQAQATPKWMTPPAGEPAPGEPVEASGKVEKALALLTKVGLSKVEMLCTTAKFVDALLEVSGAATGKLHYEGCTTKLNGSTAAKCLPRSSGAAGGLIETNALKGQIQLHESKVGQLEISPAEAGKPIVDLILGSGECAIGNNLEVTGTFFAQDSNGEFEVEAQTHVLEAGSLSSVLFGGNATTLDGSVKVDLPQRGLWSGLGATPKWMTPPAGEPLPGEPVEASGKVEKALALLTKVGLSKVEVLCTAAKFADALLEVSGAATGKLHYEGCTTKLNGSTAAKCTPHSSGAAAGLVETNALKGQIQLHESKVGQLEISPAEAGKPFVALIMGAECSIGNSIEVTGTFFAQDSSGEFEVEAQTHVLEAGSLSSVLFGGNAATLDGSLSVDLPDRGPWSGLGATPKWMTPPAGEPLPGEPVEASGKVEKALALLTKVGISKVEVLCTAAKFADALLEVSGAATGKLHYEGCTTKLNGSTAAKCLPRSSGAAGGLIETNALKGQIQLHESKVGQLEISPAEAGKPIVDLILGSGECAIGNNLEVTGTFFAQDSNGEFEVEAQTHVLEAGSLSSVLFGGNATTLDGSVKVDLPQRGLWSGLGA